MAHQGDARPSPLRTSGGLVCRIYTVADRSSTSVCCSRLVMSAVDPFRTMDAPRRDNQSACCGRGPVCIPPDFLQQRARTIFDGKQNLSCLTSIELFPSNFVAVCDRPHRARYRIWNILQIGTERDSFGVVTGACDADGSAFRLVWPEGTDQVVRAPDEQVKKVYLNCNRR
jgi:hypothetical protein